jgi:elongation factor P--(R)-beta-lysine ligase
LRLRNRLRDRANILSRIRSALAARGAIEVRTKTLLPEVLAHPTTVVFSVKPRAEGSPERLYLQASPELAMRRLVAAGSGEIYQICDAFRDERPDETHDREFLLLEWYVPGASYCELRTSVCSLLKSFYPAPETHVTCQGLFQDGFGVNLAAMSAADLAGLHRAHVPIASTNAPILDVVRFEQLLELSLRPFTQGHMICVSDYPKFDTCFGQESADGHIERFEVFINGTEIANGYQEIESSSVFLDRFNIENARRIEFGLPALPEPEVKDMPRCAGVAIGLDRLIALILDEASSVAEAV